MPGSGTCPDPPRPGGAVVVNAVLTFAGGLVVVAIRPEVMWLGCATLPETFVAATDPAAVAFEQELLEPVSR